MEGRSYQPPIPIPFFFFSLDTFFGFVLFLGHTGNIWGTWMQLQELNPGLLHAKHVSKHVSSPAPLQKQFEERKGDSWEEMNTGKIE